MYIPLGETLLEKRTCPLTGKDFGITDGDAAFYEKVSPVFGGKKYLIPFPTLSPDARQQRRIAWRNERKLYKRTCDFSGKEIVAQYHPDTPFPVYSDKVWFSDVWDPLSYGVEADFERSFYDQYVWLMGRVPHPSRSAVNTENSEYCNDCSDIKDSYLSFNGGASEDLLYCVWFVRSADCVDCYRIVDSRECYDCVNCNNSIALRYSLDCEGCSFSSYLNHCRGCLNCWECSDLENAQYCYQNKQLSKEEYFSTIASLHATGQLKPSSVGERNLLCENVDGRYLSSCRNVVGSKYLFETENARYSHDMKWPNADIMDISEFGRYVSMSYDSCVIGLSVSRLLWCFDCYDNASDLMYCVSCFRSKNLFLCYGLKDKEYCILNKQYTKEEYEVLVPRVIEKMMEDGQWGEFFPAYMSSWGYSETLAADYFPLTKEAALRLGFNWSDYEAPFPSVEKVIPGERLPETIESVPDDVLAWAIRCEKSGKLFRIVEPELAFYRKHGIPLPRRHPELRHSERLNRK